MLSRSRQAVLVGAAFVAVVALGMALKPAEVAKSSSRDSTASSNGSLFPIASAATTPPLVAGPIVRNLTTADSAALAKPKGPSPRVQAILNYNKNLSRCPLQRDTTVKAKPIPYALIVDTLTDRPHADQMIVNYDVCGLAQGGPTLFTAGFRLFKKPNRLSMGEKELKPMPSAEQARSPRQRMRFVIPTKDMPPGDYKLDVTILVRNRAPLVVSQEFKITEKLQ
jgi:hypothetical protein